MQAGRRRRLTSSLDLARGFELRGRTRRCADLLDVRGLDVLNVGCSFGWFERYALSHGARSVVGVDVADHALEAARAWVPDATFVHATALNLPFEDEGFDVVTMFEVIEHVPAGSESQALSEAWRVLRPGGHLGLSTPSRQWFTTYTDPAYYFGHRHYRRADLERMITRAGFVIDQFATGGGTFDQVELLLYYAFRHLLGRDRQPIGLVRRLADREWDNHVGSNTQFVVATKRP